MTMRGPTLRGLARDLAAGRTSSRALTQACLVAISDTAGEGLRTFLHVDRQAAVRTAAAMDLLRRAGGAPTPYAGIPISIKDLFDVMGQQTRAGSRALADAPPAAQDAPAVARLRRAGFVLVGRTNMTEFAYSGLGINPHYGTPHNPWQRNAGRVPGGSSSGAAISVTDAMAHAALGTDTGGSCRIPAAFTGIAGFKPTARRVPLAGAVPLSPNLDSIGPLARSAACCAVLDAVLSGHSLPPLEVRPLAGLRLAVPHTIALDQLAAPVALGFEAALRRLSHAGARIEQTPMAAFARTPAMAAKGGLVAADALAWHRPLIDTKRAQYDPRVLARILRGGEQSAVDYLELLAARRQLIAEARAELARFDALVLPTVAIVAPLLSDLASDEAYTRANGLALRNTALINYMDGCALTIPIHQPGEAPVGLMIAGVAGSDRRILGIGIAIEALYDEEG
jgi:aspartyl-tRNA(Asn)/glutamyl-tRNA(Gln) amidotransferase subunit A